MRAANRAIGVAVGCAALISAGWVVARDWPQWRGPNRDGKVTGFTAPQTWPTALVQKWKTTVGLGDATPALVGDRLYVFVRQGDDEATLCLDAVGGKVLWRNKYAAEAVKGPSSAHPGPRSSPAVAGGKVVTLGVGGVVSCLDAADGKLAWRKDPFPKNVPMFYTAMSPLIVDGMAVAHLGGRSKGAIIAYDLGTGNEKWRWQGEGAEYASPVLLTLDGATQIVTLTSKSAVGVALSDGKLLWRRPFMPVRRGYNAATPIVDGQTVIYTGAGRGTRAVRIEKQGDRVVATELWSNPNLAPQFNTPVLKDGLLYGLSSRGHFFCIKAATGDEAWTDSARLGGFGAILDAGSVLLALPSNGELIVLKPNGKQYEEIARIKVADTPTYAHPVVAGNRIFVKDRDTLTLWTIPR